uniref:Uncharacterized protein n=1 Tax=Peronospora matthiolae TaxID=2874970 RepID=A0AAV1VD07_9STRA
MGSKYRADAAKETALELDAPVVPSYGLSKAKKPWARQAHGTCASRSLSVKRSQKLVRTSGVRRLNVSNRTTLRPCEASSETAG